MSARQFHVLLVEDNPGDARLTVEALREVRATARVTHVRDGSGALAILRQSDGAGRGGRPDLILLDWNLPGKGGCDVLAEIKADAVLRHIPVVVLTSSASDADVASAYRLRANCYVEKPSGYPEFRQVVRRIDEFWMNTAMLPGERA